MTTADLAKLIGKTITVCDERTAAEYETTVLDAKAVYGHLRLCVSPSPVRWFEPTEDELRSVEN